MEGFKDTIAGVVTAHENGSYRPGANEAADCIVRAMTENGHSKWSLLAAGKLVEEYEDDATADVEDFPVDQLWQFMDEHYLCAGATVGSALEEYASLESEERTGSELARAYEALDRAGMVDFLGWADYADSGMTPVKDLRFIQMPVPAGEAGVFVFTV